MTDRRVKWPPFFLSIRCPRPRSGRNICRCPYERHATTLSLYFFVFVFPHPSQLLSLLLVLIRPTPCSFGCARPLFLLLHAILWLSPVFLIPLHHHLTSLPPFPPPFTLSQSAGTGHTPGATAHDSPTAPCIAALPPPPLPSSPPAPKAEISSPNPSPVSGPCAGLAG